NLVVNALAIVVAAITLAGIWFAPALVTAIAPGFADIPGKVELTVTLTRIMFPFLLLVALAAVAMGILNTRHIFGVPAAASAFVNNIFASYLGNGPVSWLNVAFRFMQLPIGLFGVAIGTVTLPLVSRHGARGDTRAFRTTVGQALELVALFCLPAAAGLALLGVPVIGLVYEHGRFAP